MIVEQSVSKVPDNFLVINNDSFSDYVILKDKMFKVKQLPSCNHNSIQLSQLQRTYLNLTLKERVTLLIPDKNPEEIEKVAFEISTLKKSDNFYLTSDVTEKIQEEFKGIVIHNNLKYIFKHESKILNLQTFDLSPKEDGKKIITENTVLQFIGSGENISFEHSQEKHLFKKNFNFNELGIGGLDNEFFTLFRRAFTPLILKMTNPKLFEKLNIRCVKGILLHGPPGCGKTLTAKKLSEVLNCDPQNVKTISGPEILNQYVGGSEEKLRAIFEPAMKDKSGKIHVVIFDEFDSIGVKRGSRTGSTGVNDNLVNQLLAIMDGVTDLGNIVIIAMTNHLHTLDEALLRPGRFEIHLKIDLPDEKGRFDILSIHTKKMGENGLLSENVDLKEIAKKTVNFSGAEIAGLVTNVSSFMLSKQMDIANNNFEIEESSLVATMDDFINASKEIKPLMGSFSEELSILLETSFELYTENYSHIFKNIVEEIDSCAFGKNKSILLYGEPFTGKTLMSAQITKHINNFGCVRFICSEHLKYSSIFEIFNKCLNCESSLIILDSLENLVSYCKLGYKYDNNVLQDIFICLKHIIERKKRCVVLITSSDEELINLIGLREKVNYYHQISTEMKDEHFTYSEYFKMNG